jgi:sarcosine oxidase subunit delta
MRITCPYCGARGNEEFTYLGDAAAVRPDPARPDAPQAFHDFTYLRSNPAGPHREFWYHGAGCHAWLVVTRDTRTHEITKVELADAATPPPARTTGSAA